MVTFSSPQNMPKENFLNKLKDVWNVFSSRDRFTKLSIITSILVVLTVPALIAQQTGFFTHAAGSLHSTCIVPPAGFNLEELQQLSQNGKVNWCKTLAQNTVATSQENPNASGIDTGNSLPAPSADTNIFSAWIMRIQQILLSVQRLFTGR